MDCEIPMLVIKPLLFLYIVTASQVKDIIGWQVEENDGIVLL